MATNTINELIPQTPAERAYAEPAPSSRSAFEDAISPRSINAGVITAPVLDFVNKRNALSARVKAYSEMPASGVTLQVFDGVGGDDIKLDNQIHYDSSTQKGSFVWNTTDDGQMSIGHFADGQNVFSLTSIDILNDLDPYADDSVDLGASGRMYSDIWCTTIHRTSESSPSDASLKQAVAPIEWGLDEILKLKPVRFQWKATGRSGYGFIAQDLERVIPELVTPIQAKVEIRHRKGKVPKSVDPRTLRRDLRDPAVVIEKRTVEASPKLLQIELSALVPILVQAIQELRDEVHQIKKSK